MSGGPRAEPELSGWKDVRRGVEEELYGRPRLSESLLLVLIDRMSQRRPRRCSLVRGGARNGRFKENCERNNQAPGSNKSGPRASPVKYR